MTDQHELQRLQTETAKQQAIAAAAEHETLVLKAAAGARLPAGLVGRLQGATLEELTADAASLAAALPAQRPATPRADHSQGGRAGQTPETPAAAFGSFLRRAINGGRTY